METFEITIQRKVGDAWPVIVEQSSAEALMPIRAEGNLCVEIAQLDQRETDARAYGTLLGQALFQGSIRDAFVESVAKCSDCLRVLLFVEDPTLRGLHWERLCAPLDNGWELLALNQRTPFSHYLPSLNDRRFPPIGRQDLRALILAADPAGLSKYKLAPFGAAQAIAGVRAALGSIPTAVLAEVEGAAGPPTLDALCERITAEHITLLHLVCHGRVGKDGETAIFLAKSDAPDEVDLVTATELIDRLGNLRGKHGLPHFAFLSTCESASGKAELALGGLAQRLVRELGMPAVIAMTEPVSIATANALATVVYQRLCEHGEVDRALAEATAGLSERDDITVAALYSRLGGRPLFSDRADRPLTNIEIANGLAALKGLLVERAPVLQDEFAQLEAQVRGGLEADRDSLSPAARQERDAALEQIETICAEAIDMSFAALALGNLPPPYDGRCPFPGLASFTINQRSFFFGRKPLIEQLLRRLDDHPFLAVLGPSGSGKSSLVQAGLAPQMQQRAPGLELITLTPGANPLAQLEARLASATQPEGVEKAVGDQPLATPAAKPRLIVVDQFEELFTLCADARERQAFLDRLLALPGAQQYVAITMRADFWGECAGYPELRAQMQAHQELIAPMDANELRQAIEQQAAAVGLRFEADLSSDILDDVQSEPGAMPLLQHALQELWQRRRGRWLRNAEYRAIGGIQQAIAHTADGIYAQSTPDDKERLRNIFVRLTRLDQDGGEEQRDTRQRVRLAELVPAGADPAATRELVRRLANSRLLVTSVNAATGEDQVEVAHEALIRSWPRLRAWINEDRAGLQLLETIRQRARDWQAGGQDEGLLLSGNLLDRAEELSRQPRFALNAEERAFLDAGVQLRKRHEAEREAARREREALLEARAVEAEARQQAEAEARKAAEARQQAEEQARQQAERDREQLRRRAIILAGVVAATVVATLVAAVLGFMANSASQRAEQQRATAVAEGQRADQQRATAEAASQRADQQRATAVAEKQRADAARDESLHRAMVADAQAALSGNNTDQALALARAAASLNPPVPQAQFALAEAAFRPGTYRRFTGHTGVVNSVAINADGEIASGSNDGTLILWNISDGTIIRQLKSQSGAPVLSVAFSPDQRAILAGSADGGLQLWDVGNGRPFATDVYTSPVLSVAFSSDGRHALSGSADGKLILWDVSDGKPIRAFEGDHGAVNSVTFSPDGSQALSGAADGTLILWNVSDGTAIRTFESRGSFVNSVAFSPDGSQALAGAVDGTLMLWNVSDGRPIRLLAGHTDSVNSVAFSPDGSQALSGSADHTVRLWDVETGKELLTFSGHSGAVTSVLFADRETVISGSADSTLRLWDLKNRQALGSFEQNPVPINSVAFSPDGSQALSGLDDGTLILWDTADARILRSFTGHTGAVASVLFGKDGKSALSGSADGTLRLWNLADGQLIRAYQGHSKPITGVALGPDGQTALSSSLDGTLRLWNLADGQELRRFEQPGEPAISVALSPDGKSALSGSNDGTIILWNIADGQIVRSFSGHRRSVNSVAFSPDGSQALSGSDDGAMILWNVSDGKPIRPFESEAGFVDSVAFSPDGKSALSGSDDMTVRLWDLASGKELRQFKGHNDWVRSVAFSPDGKSALSGSDDTTMRLWNLADGQELRTFAKPSGPVLSAALSPDGTLALSGSGDGTIILWSTADGQIVRSFSGHDGPVNSLAFSPDGSQALSGGADGLVILWNVDSGQKLRQFSGHTDWVRSVAFSPDGKSALSGSDDMTVRLWDLASGKELRQFSGHTDWVRSVAFSPDGKSALSGAEDGAVILWNVADGQIIRRLLDHKGAVFSVAFSPDGKTALSGSDDTTMRLWNLADGQVAQRFSGHTGPVNSVAFSPDGKSVLSGAGDTTVRLWNVETGQESMRFTGHSSGVTSIAYNLHDSSKAISSSNDGTMRLWNIDTAADLIDFADNARYVPDLTREQCEQYRVEQLCAAPSPTPSPTPAP